MQIAKSALGWMAIPFAIDTRAKSFQLPGHLSGNGIVTDDQNPKLGITISGHGPKSFAQFIESAGLATPCSTALLKRSGDRDASDIKELVGLMSPGTDYALEDLGAICEEHEICERFISLKQEKSGNAYRSAFGKFLTGYDGRMFGPGIRFQIAGTAKHRKYRIALSDGEV
jgi:hypothetical protein